MTPSTTDQYQRALELLDDDRFWDRYLAHLPGDGQSEETGEPASASNVVSLPTPRKPDTRGATRLRTWRSTNLQRAALAAAAAAAVVAGVAIVNYSNEPEPLDVFTNPIPTVLTEVPDVVVGGEREPEPTPAPTATPAPAPTSGPEPTPLADAVPASPPVTETDDPGADSPDAVSPDTDEPTAPPETATGTAPSSSIDSNSAPGQVLGVINELRRDQGLSELSYSPALSVVAHEQAWALTNFQDTFVSRAAGASVDQAWVEANFVGGIDIEGRLPAGWVTWDHNAGRGPVLDVVRAQSARNLQLGNFTHVGVASASGKFADATVLLYVDYARAAPAETSIAVRTDGRCFAQVADLNRRDRTVLEPQFVIASDERTDQMTEVRLRFCAGVVSPISPGQEHDSRYRVSVERRSDGRVMGSFTCFAGNTCEAVVNLDRSSGPFDIVLRRVSIDDIEIVLGQATATFRTTDGTEYRIVSGNGGSGAGDWVLESDS